MDWVKPKHRARQIKQPDSKDSGSASEWLKQLCDENVALLQASLPIGPAHAKHKDDAIPIEEYLRAMLWGTGCWEIVQPNASEFLFDLVESFGDQVGLQKRKTSTSKSKSKKSATASNELRAHQVSHATNIGKWITQQLPKSGHDPYVALTCAGWLHALPEVGRNIPPSLWLDVLQCTLTQVERAWTQSTDDGLFPWIIWACEAPLALAKQLSHLGGKDRIVSETLNRIALVLEQSSDDMQPFLSFGAQDLRAIVASIIRCRWAADAVGARKWYPPQRKALSKLGVAMLHLSDTDGLSFLAEAGESIHDPAMWQSLVAMCSDNKKLQYAVAVSAPDEVARLLGHRASKLRKDNSLDAVLPNASHYWAKGTIASMRRTWRAPGCRICIDFSSDVIWLDILDEKGRRIVSGDWDIELKRDGEMIPVDVAWQEVCWFTDDDVDYLELECDLEGVCKVQRQIMLVKDDGLVFMADAVISDSDHEWSTKSTWTLANDVAFVPQSKTNEAKLCVHNEDSERTAALVLPVAMPEWRRSATRSSLAAHGKNIHLETTGTAKRIYGPLVLALKGVAKEPAYTWRQLTIAEELVIQPRDVAEAYRVQVADDHWLFYRSLTPFTRRTVMGLHLLTEFYAARFEPKEGTFEPLIEVNPE